MSLISSSTHGGKYKAAWDVFSRRLVAQQWLRGGTLVRTDAAAKEVAAEQPKAEDNTADVNGTLPSPSVSSPDCETTLAPDTPNDDAPPSAAAPEVGAAAAASINLDVWNVYWERYSDTYGTTLDRLGPLLKRARGEPSDKSSVVPYHRVLLSISWGETASTDMMNWVSAHMERIVAHAAHEFGALEMVRLAGHVVHVQFTTAQSASAFQLWVSGMSLSDLVAAGSGASELVSAPSPPSPPIDSVVQEPSYRSAFLRACLAPLDATRATSRLLLMLPHASLPTAYVEGLFLGMLDASAVAYHVALKAFVVDFKDVDGAQLALHAVQYALWKEFNMSLEYL